MRGGQGVVETVVTTPRGPIISPALPGEERAISLRAVWLEPLPIQGTLRAQHAGSFEEFRRRFLLPAMKRLEAQWEREMGERARRLEWLARAEP